MLVTAAGGRLDSQNQQPGTDAQPARAALVIRVPSARYEAVVADIQKLGGVTQYSTEASDVTQQKQDIDARISALQTSTKRLESLMADADSTADLIEIENALSGRQAELDSLTTQRDYLEDQVAFSTLSVDFTAPGVVSPGSPAPSGTASSPGGTRSSGSSREPSSSSGRSCRGCCCSAPSQ